MLACWKVELGHANCALRYKKASNHKVKKVAPKRLTGGFYDSLDDVDS